MYMLRVDLDLSVYVIFSIFCSYFWNTELGLAGKDLNLLATRMYTFSYGKSIWPVSWHFRVFKFAISGPTFLRRPLKPQARPKALKLFFALMRKYWFSKVAKIVIKCSYTKGIQIYRIIYKSIFAKKQSILVIMVIICLFWVSLIEIVVLYFLPVTFGKRSSVIPKEKLILY